ncbi:MAG: helix-turn-helix domain-containing protein [Bacteroidia bacterium]
MFQIFQLNTSDAKVLSAAPDDPHSHDYEELIVLMKGKVSHFIDFANHEILAPAVIFVSKGKIHRIIPFLQDDESSAWVIRFKSEFIPETTFQLYSFYHHHAHILMQEGMCFKRITVLCEMMQMEMESTHPDYAVIKHLLGALFAMMESERKKQKESDLSMNKTHHITFKNFLNILEQNFRRSEGVEFYAEKLFMSTRNLNLICQQILNMSVSEIIETRKLIEAKNLLIHSQLSISEIGFELGYKDKSYFTSVFKKKSGQTPTEFREEMMKQLKV